MVKIITAVQIINKKNSHLSLQDIRPFDTADEVKTFKDEKIRSDQQNHLLYCSQTL